MNKTSTLVGIFENEQRIHKQNIGKSIHIIEQFINNSKNAKSAKEFISNDKMARAKPQVDVDKTISVKSAQKRTSSEVP